MTERSAQGIVKNWSRTGQGLAQNSFAASNLFMVTDVVMRHAVVQNTAAVPTHFDAEHWNA
jgi:hypothetical protein